MKIKTLSALGTAAAMLASGCTMAPKYKQPALPVPQTYADASAPKTAATAPAAVTPAAPDIPWQDFFGDARLKALIALALENNRDLRIAVLNVEQARAQYRIQRAQLMPTIGAGASAERQRVPADLSPSGQAQTYNEFLINGELSYEIDLFGKIRSLKQAALEAYLATDEARVATRLTLVATVATQYLAVRALDEQYALAEQMLKLVQNSLDLIQRRYDAGTASELDLASAKTQVAATQASLADITRQLAQANDALALVVGAPLPADLPPPQPLINQNIVADVPAGLPSDLLTRRPDILAAEHNLRGADANIGAARAAFFPSITLTGLGGYGSLELHRLFSAGQFIWDVLPSVSIPIFSGGAIRANLQYAEASQKIMIAQYEKAIQTAFSEVSDALAARRTYVDEVAADVENAAEEQRRYDLSFLRYQHGVDDYLSVLTAQQSLFQAQQSLVQARMAQLANLVSLYQALGGGWDEKDKSDKK